MKKYRAICLSCNKEFLFNSNHLSRGPKYCSRLCSYNGNKDNFLNHAKKHSYRKGHRPWNKDLNKESNAKIKHISEIRKGAKRPNVSKMMRQNIRKYWNDDKILFNIINGQSFGKGHIPNELDKKAIEAKILIHKIRRNLKCQQQKN